MLLESAELPDLQLTSIVMLTADDLFSSHRFLEGIYVRLAPAMNQHFL